MTFFEDQRIARQKTWLLLTYLLLAVIGIATSVYLVIAILLSQGEHTGDISPAIWQPETFAATFMAVLLVVTLGSLYKTFVLRGGGQQIATALGGTLILPSTTDPEERRILNVVEEMAIASGVPVPPVYVMNDEPGINAFAAGFDVDQAVVGVTRGTIHFLTRDELQGVIAHEFSHILNGDMRLNIRLIGVVHGILIIGLVGYWILRSGTSSRRRSSREGKGAAGWLIFGLSIYIIGYIGVFFGKLIKAAISRQREFLADSSAVQFTRHPDGISGALKKIGGLTAGSQIESSHAPEASHMFFATGLKQSFFNMLATHPPLEERIRRIDPRFEGKFSEVAEPQPVSSTSPERPAHAAISGFAEGRSIAVSAGSVIEQIGHPEHKHLEYARSLIASLPLLVQQQAREPFGARALIYTLMLDRDAEVRKTQTSLLQQSEDPDTWALIEKLIPFTSALGLEVRLPIVDLSIPSLKLLSQQQYSSFRENLQKLAGADNACSLFEYALHHILLRHVDPEFSEIKKKPRSYRPHLVTAAGVSLIENLSLAGSDEPTARRSAYDMGMKEFKVVPEEPFDETGSSSLDEFDRSLTILATAQPGMKKHIIAACTACIATDGQVTIEEAEMLRTIADALACPIPPFLPGASV